MSKIRNLIRQRFGRLMVLSEAGRDKWKNVLWLCKCDCGNEKVIASGNLIRGTTQSCGCYNKERITETRFKNLSGQQFGRLIVLDKPPIRKRINTGTVIFWRCKCECGKEVVVRTGNLNSGGAQSCGCHHREKTSERLSGENHHGWKGGITPLHATIRRCTEYLHWRLDVYSRDGFKCQHCKDVDKRNLNAHHKKPFTKVIEENNIKTLREARNCEELWDVDNGITLCKDCHELEHKRVKQKEFDMNLN